MVTTYPKGKETLGIRKAWKGGQNEVVLKKAKPDSIYPSQHLDYVSVKSSGQIVARDGSFIVERGGDLYKELPQKNNPLAPDPKTGVKLPKIEGVGKPKKHPDAHIPLDEWLKWKKHK